MLHHPALYRGPRRGELCGLDGTDVATHFSLINVVSQLAEVDCEVEETRPKPQAGSRTIGLDRASGEAVRLHLLRK